MQLYGQASFIAHFWNEPAFTLRNANGAILHSNLTMPNLCKAQFNLNLPTDASRLDIEAWVLCVSMQDAKPFGPYTPHSSMQNLCLTKAEELWECKTEFEAGELDVNSVNYASGLHALCAYCDWNSDCPKFHDGLYRPDWDSEFQKLATLKEERDTLEERIAQIEQSIKDAYALTSLQGDWITTGSYRFKLSTQKGRRNLNKEALHQALQKAHGENADNILSACEQEGKPFQKLTINKIN